MRIALTGLLPLSPSQGPPNRRTHLVFPSLPTPHLVTVFPPCTFSGYTPPERLSMGCHRQSSTTSLSSQRNQREPYAADSGASESPSSPESPPVTPGTEDRASQPTDDNAPSSSQRTRSSMSNGPQDSKEKRKRSRVTPEQLVQLERFFASDRSPTATRRKEISDLLGMNERQTQIWFQNRRAKAKLQAGANKGRGLPDYPPDSPFDMRSGDEAAMRECINESGPVTFIPCTDLAIGTWRRIATALGRNDLIAYVNEGKRCFSWFIQSEGAGFKMEIPFEHIVETTLSHIAPGMGLAIFCLFRPPVFFLETTSASSTATRVWKGCADWTEAAQATKVLRHELVGSASQLADLLRRFDFFKSYSTLPPRPPHTVAEGESFPTATSIAASRQSEAFLLPGISQRDNRSDGPLRNGSCRSIAPTMAGRASHSPEYPYPASVQKYSSPSYIQEGPLSGWSSDNGTVHSPLHMPASKGPTLPPYSQDSLPQYANRYQGVDTRSISPYELSGSSDAPSSASSPSYGLPSPRNIDINGPSGPWMSPQPIFSGEGMERISSRSQLHSGLPAYPFPNLTYGRPEKHFA